MAKKILLNVFYIACLSILTGELALYAFGYRANAETTLTFEGTTTLDAVLGWKHVPGSYHFTTQMMVSPRTFSITYLEDGRRASSRNVEILRPALALFGCSFVEGFGLGDEETFAWKLQEKLKDYTVENFGVAGYGTINSLLAFEQFAGRQENVSGRVAIYGFAEFHLLRNVQNPLIQRTWGEEGIFPVCNENSCYSWRGKMMSGMFRRSRLFSLVENALHAVQQWRLRGEAERVTERLILRMKQEAADQGIRLVIAPVAPLAERWLSFFRSSGLEVIQCATPAMFQREYLLPDGHPNSGWSEMFSSCLADRLSRAP